MFDDQTAERIIILGSKFRMKMIVDIVKAHGALNNIFLIGNFLDEFVFVLVVFVVNLTDDLLKDILEGDKTGHLAVFVKNDSDIKSRFPHFHEKIRDILVFIGKMWLTEKVPDIKRIILIIKKKVLHIDDTNDIVLCVLIDWKTGKSVCTENIDQFFVSIVYVGKSYIDTGNHDVLGICISEIENVVDHFFFVGFNDTILVADIHDGTELFLGHGFVDSIRIYMQDVQEKSGYQIDHKDHGCHESHQKMNDSDITQGKLFGIKCCIVFWCDLSEYQDRNCQCQRCNADHVASQVICKCSCKR